MNLFCNCAEVFHTNFMCDSACYGVVFCCNDLSLQVAYYYQWFITMASLGTYQSKVFTAVLCVTYLFYASVYHERNCNFSMFLLNLFAIWMFVLSACYGFVTCRHDRCVNVIRSIRKILLYISVKKLAGYMYMQRPSFKESKVGTSYNLVNDILTYGL